MKRETRTRALRAALALLALAAACCLVVFVLRPPCLILETTGYYCAGCGGQRMISALLQGDFSGAFRQNPFLFVFLPAAAVYLVAEAVRYVQEKIPLCRSKRFIPLLLAVLTLALLFTILRNLPGFGFLGPF